MLTLRTAAEAAQAARRLARPLALVPTLGALHAGHLALVEAARRDCASVMATIFVNPRQFGPTADFLRYPRALAEDSRQLETVGVDMLFAPSVAEMYPPGFDTNIDPGPIATRYEGALRPGHFRGVATVCAKLFAISGAECAYFGAKDAQQVAVLLQLVRDLALPTGIVVVPTIRDEDGLALSSRNTYLRPAECQAAPGLYRALQAMADAVTHGETNRDRIVAAGRTVIASPLREAYLDVVDPLTFEPLPDIGARSAPCAVTAIGSAWLGDTRLIDNLTLTVPAARNRADSHASGLHDAACDRYGFVSGDAAAYAKRHPPALHRVTQVVPPALSPSRRSR
jgi:pantoate--beta-alanine ligase